MIEYKVVSTPRQDRLEETVSALLNTGWVLHGSTFVAGSGGMTQCMTKETKSPVVPTKLTKPNVKT
jgi:hypothetical protein